MSNKIKERLKNLQLELDHIERMMLDEGLVKVTKTKDCDEAIDLVTDDQLRKIVANIKKRKKKQIEVPMEAN
jgi:hypothetical protein